MTSGNSGRRAAALGLPLDELGGELWRKTTCADKFVPPPRTRQANVHARRARRSNCA